ncbi:hypothetical protein WMY93_011858 [Mugilogobius chulae]|uniref:Uncharacterized protein n=1 Tax=Mugilogobius chulae TaxID=88201 RepID=A0AAW0P794_9GOBI
MSKTDGFVSHESFLNNSGDTKGRPTPKHGAPLRARPKRQHSPNAATLAVIFQRSALRRQFYNYAETNHRVLQSAAVRLRDPGVCRFIEINGSAQFAALQSVPVCADLKANDYRKINKGTLRTGSNLTGLAQMLSVR